MKAYSQVRVPVCERDPLPVRAVQQPPDLLGVAGHDAGAGDQHRHQLRLPPGRGPRQHDLVPRPPPRLRQGKVQRVDKCALFDIYCFF